MKKIVTPAKSAKSATRARKAIPTIREVLDPIHNHAAFSGYREDLTSDQIFNQINHLEIMKAFLPYRHAFADREDLTILKIHTGDTPNGHVAVVSFITADDAAVITLIRSVRSAIRGIWHVTGDAAGDVDTYSIEMALTDENYHPDFAIYDVSLSFPAHRQDVTRKAARAFFEALSIKH